MAHCLALPADLFLKPSLVLGPQEHVLKLFLVLALISKGLVALLCPVLLHFLLTDVGRGLVVGVVRAALDEFGAKHRVLWLLERLIQPMIGLHPIGDNNLLLLLFLLLLALPLSLLPLLLPALLRLLCQHSLLLFGHRARWFVSLLELAREKRGSLNRPQLDVLKWLGFDSRADDFALEDL